MSLLIWNDSYSVRNDTIDEQHRILFDIFNKLHLQCNNNDRESLHEILLELHKYTLYHFKDRKSVV